MRVDVGSFVKASVTGNQDITVPVDLTAAPAGSWAIIFWTAGGSGATGVWTPHTFPMVGFVVGAGASDQYAVCGVSYDNIAASDTAREIKASALVFINPNTGGPTRHSAQFVSFPTATSMRLAWTTNGTGAGFDSTVINYMILSGLTGAKVVNTVIPATNNQHQSVSGVGFKPDLVLHAANLVKLDVVTATISFQLLGAMNSRGQQWANGVTAYDGVNPADTARHQQADACVAGGGIQAHYLSMDPDGFSWFWSAAGSSISVNSLCLKGVSSRLGAAVSRVGAGTQDIHSRHGFTPKAAVFASCGDNPQGAESGNWSWGMGATDGVNKRAAHSVDMDNVTPTQTDSVWTNDKSLFVGTQFQATALAADATLERDKIALTYATADAAREFLYLLLGDAGADSFPAMVT